MRTRRVLGLLLVASLALFAAAALAPSDSQAILLATAGALLPAAGMVLVAWSNALRWRRMGQTLGLVAREGGMFPDLEGRYGGRRLVVSRRTNPYGMGPRLNTLVHLEGTPQVLLPGLVADAATVEGILEPLLEPRRAP